MHRTVRGLACALVAAVVAAPMSAAVYTINLHNGHSFESRYEPQEASWDASKVVFVDEVGLTIALDRADIESIASDFESKGYGSMIDATTMELGWAPNDLAAPDDGSSTDPMAQIERLMSQQPQQQSVTYGQFVEPDQTQGMPAQWVGLPNDTSPQPVVVPVPVPVPSAPAGGAAPVGE